MVSFRKKIFVSMYRNILEDYIPKILTVVILGDGGNMGNSVVLYNYLYFLLFRIIALSQK